MKKPVEKPKRVVRTQVPFYFFSAAKAAQSAQNHRGAARKSSKLPTSIDELRALKVTR